MMQRHSSRRNRLDQAVLNQRLDGAVSYDRIAGYFRSSLFNTLLLRRLGSSMEAGRRTGSKLLAIEPETPDDEDDAEEK